MGVTAEIIDTVEGETHISVRGHRMSSSTKESCKVIERDRVLFWGEGVLSGHEVTEPTVQAAVWQLLCEIARVERRHAVEAKEHAQVRNGRVLEELDVLKEKGRLSVEVHNNAPFAMAHGRLQGRLDYIVDELKRRQDFILQRMDEASLTGVMDEKVTAWDDAAGTEVEPG